MKGAEIKALNVVASAKWSVPVADLCDIHEAAQICGLTTKEFRALLMSLQRQRKPFPRALDATGKRGKKLYWRRSEWEKWAQANKSPAR